MIGLTYDEMMALDPCAENSRAVTKLLGGAKKWNGKKISAAQAVAAGVSFDDLLWAAVAVARTDKDVERRLRLWMADCAAHVLHILVGLLRKNGSSSVSWRGCPIPNPKIGL